MEDTHIQFDNLIIPYQYTLLYFKTSLFHKHLACMSCSYYNSNSSWFSIECNLKLKSKIKHADHSFSYHRMAQHQLCKPWLMPRSNQQCTCILAGIYYLGMCKSFLSSPIQLLPDWNMPTFWNMCLLEYSHLKQLVLIVVAGQVLAVKSMTLWHSSHHLVIS